MDPNSFEANKLRALRAPLNGPNGRAYVAATGRALDDEQPVLVAAGQAGSPLRCPDEALENNGPKFNLERYEGDTDATYRARLIIAFGTWKKAGSAASIEEQVTAYGVVSVTVYDAAYMSRPEFSQFEIWIGDQNPSIHALFLGGSGGFGVGPWILGDSLLGSTLTPAQLVTIKRLVLKFKAAHGYPVVIRMIDGSYGFDAMGNFRPMTTYPIGRTLGETWPTLGDATCILGGYEV